MTAEIGSASIALRADSSEFKKGIDDARKSIKSFGNDLSDNIGTATGKASKSIDRYVRGLQQAADTQGKSARETALYTLALKGASEAQLVAANSALRMSEAYQQGVVIGEKLRTGFIAVATAATAAVAGTVAGTISLINQVAKYQDLAEKIGDTATNISSLKSASDVTGTSLETIATASVKLTAALSKTDDESKSVGSALSALGIDFQKFKSQSPVEQLQTVARAFEGFADESEKSAVAVSLLGKSGADLLPFLKEYATEGLKAAYVSDEQVRAADELADSSAKLKSKFDQLLQVAAVGAIPTLSQVGDLFKSIATDEATVSTATDVLKGALSAIVVVFQTIAVVGANVGFVLLSVGREIGAIAAQGAALARLDFKGFNAISQAVKEDGARARKELDKFTAQVMAIGTGAPGKPAAPTIAGVPRPRLNISGLSQDKDPKTKKDNSAAQEAKAQLASDLEDIRKSTEAMSNTISNAEKISAAQRAASLISEKDYYAAKRENLIANEAIQEFGAQREIDRLKQEALVGKDKIDNDRKIADAEAKLAKIRANSTTDLQVLSIQEKASLDAIAKRYEDARIAAQSYLDVARKALNLELSGMGKGDKARNKDAALSQIADKYEAQRQDLARSKRDGAFAGRDSEYDKELARINEFQSKALSDYEVYYAKREAQESDFSLGASRALENYYDEAQNVFAQTEQVVTHAFQGMEDSLVSFVTTGKLSFSRLADSIVADITRIIIKQQIANAAAAVLGSAGGGSGGGFIGTIASFFGGGKASGGPVSSGKLYQVNERGPELLNVAGKQYLMMGANSGSITPNSGGGGNTVNVSVNQTFGPNTSRATTLQAAADARRVLESAGRNI